MQRVNFMKNQEFCYWLQGYFEIALQPELSKKHLILIREALDRIEEPLGSFTQWLYEVTSFLSSQNYKPGLVNCFLQEIKDRLNLIFFHVIDNTYDTILSRAELKKIHDGFS